MIKLEKVTYCYPDREEPVLDQVDMEVKPGEMVAVIGPNGSGKSTLAKLLNGLLLPVSGSVTVDGLDTTGTDAVWEIRRRVGLILQNPDNQLVAPTVEEDVAFGPENLGVEPGEIRRRIKAALDLVGMSEYANHSPNRLSGGQKQRVAIAGVFAMQPSYLVLDEATSMLDPRGRTELMQTVQSLTVHGVGCVMITHHMNEAALADKVVVLVRGRVELMGSPQQVFGNSSVLRRHGLQAPTAARIADSLRRGGMPLPQGILCVEELVKALC